MGAHVEQHDISEQRVHIQFQAQGHDHGACDGRFGRPQICVGQQALQIGSAEMSQLGYQKPAETP